MKSPYRPTSDLMIHSSTTSIYNRLPNTGATNGEYLYWYKYWQVIRDCIMGEILIKERKTTYLPRTGKQSDEEYDAYLARATYYNMTARTVSGLVGSVHSRPPVISNLPNTIDLSSISNDGQSFDMFMKKMTKEVVSVGRYGVMIDAPREEDGGDPYLVGYEAEDIVDWSTVRVGSREKLQYVVLREIKMNRVPFQTLSEDYTENYRVLFIDEDGIYRQRVYEDGVLTRPDYEEFTPLLQGRPLTEIPFLFVGPYDFGTNIEKPPIMDIALLNLSHYHSYAQLESGRFYTANPIYAVFLAAGGDDDVEYKVGPNTVWQLGSQDKAELIEFSGSGLTHLETALTSKEAQIASIGGRLNSQVRGMAAESADAVLARERGEASFLGSVIATLSEAGSRLLSTLALWRGSVAQVEVTYSSDATDIRLDAREIRAITMLYDTGLLPLETLFSIYKQSNIVPSGVSFEEFQMMLPERAPKVHNKLDEAEGKAQIEEEYAPEIPVQPVNAPKTPQNRQNQR